ncbi:alpha/beta hydrolase [Pseudoalteromonas sp. SMS1]|uniref:alpha/beta hydrolase n=1 Tax=Pseudoalteromonas sp. SMS1 TaxID=2908894 RepID=UPI001EEA51C4|nr:alpha/beta hydrolase-fold protein [Pseudoalteromonas sp. SMS1]MCF2859638.1 alpha/beta hydrolase [Pseudoalteromonas sp. SMS1]
MKKYIVIVVMACLPFLKLQAKVFDAYSMPRTEVVPIKNSVNGGQYELLIKLPEGYADKPKQHFPVIYYTDAVWQIDLLSAATTFLMDEVILVGISWQKDMDEQMLSASGAHLSRFRDYTVTSSKDLKRQAKYQFGKANEHLAFIRQDVFNLVEKRYRTRPAQRAYFGYSLGGQFGLYALLAHPDTFKYYILGSPSIGGSVDYLSMLLDKKNNISANVFISYGDKEGRLSQHVDTLLTKLKSSSQSNMSLTHEVMRGDHSQAVPMTAARGVAWLSQHQSTVH